MRTLRIEDWFGCPGDPLSIVRKEPQEPFTLHAHEFSEMVIVFGGSALHVAGGESWPVTVGDVFVVGGSQAHDYRHIKDLRLINVLFRPEKVSLEPHRVVGISRLSKTLFVRIYKLQVSPSEKDAPSDGEKVKHRPQLRRLA
jgi:hypothetical protein